MQTKREQLGYEMTLLPPLESLIPADHHLRRLNKVLDLDFVHETVRDRYCQDNGRPSIDPEVIIRLFLLQAMEGITHVRDLMRQVQVNLAYRWFIGYRLDEKLPDHSTLSRALDRLGDDVFDELFSRSIGQCQRSGLIEGKVLHVDATTIRADIDANRVNQPASSDADARFGRFADGSKQPGYKQHTVADDQSRVVLGVKVTPANVSEGGELVGLLETAQKQLDRRPEAVCADTAYASGENAQRCEGHGVPLISPPAIPRNHHSHEQFTIEQFYYDETGDQFICPQGKVLVRVGQCRSKKKRFNYRASAKDCRECPLKGQCTKTLQRSLNVGEHHGALVRLRSASHGEEFRILYRRRAPVIEGVFAEAKQWHGLRRAWRRGLAKMRVQCLLIAAILNFKRLAAVFGALFGLRVLYKTIMDTIRPILTVSDDQHSPGALNLIDA
jgi:transposase